MDVLCEAVGKSMSWDLVEELYQGDYFITLHGGRLFCYIAWWLQELALTQFRKTGEKTLTLGYRLDMMFHQIRIGLFYMDHDLIKRSLEKAQT